MGQIKSALELALERTESIKSDKESLIANEIRTKGKQAASKVLNPGDEISLAAELKKVEKNQRQWFKEGFINSILANLTLPTAEGFEDSLKRVEEALIDLTGDKKQIPYIIEQIGQFFSQYLQNKEQIFNSLKSQYEPRLREKEQALAQQLGSEIKLDPMQEPEFAKAYRQNTGQLEQQYQNALNEVKDQIKSLSGI